MANYKKIIKNIAFFGDADLTETDPVYVDAFNTAKLMAEKGYAVVNGGGPGVMNASTQGAKSVGGETVSVTFTPNNAPGFEGRYVGNITDKEIKTSNYVERMFKLMENADFYLIFKGGTGTVSEFGTAWVLAKLYYGHHKPFVLVGSFWRPIVEAMKTNLNIDDAEMDVFEIVDEGKEALPLIQKFEEKMNKLDHSNCKVCGERAFMT